MFDVRVSAGGREVNTAAMATITMLVMAMMKIPLLAKDAGTNSEGRIKEEERRERGRGRTESNYSRS